MTDVNIPKIFRNEDGKIIADLIGGKLYKQVYRSRHMLRKPEGWAINQDIIEELQTNKTCTDIIIFDKENGLMYQVKFDKFYQYKVDIERGYGAQCVLPLTYWEVQESDE